MSSKLMALFDGAPRSFATATPPELSAQIPIDKIKIDRSFIDDVSSSVASPKIVQAVVSLANCLDLKTTAEGVETEQQLGAIRAMGNPFSPPGRAGEISQLISPRSECAA